MNYIKISKNDIANGEGVRVVLWVAGCSHHCFNCQNSNTWDKNAGHPFTEKEEDEILELLNNSFVSGITFSGGDPLFINNREQVLLFLQKIRQQHPDKTIWIYTGFTYEYIMQDDLLKQLFINNLCDVLVDGPFIQSLYDIRLKWRGSSNQRVIDVRKTQKSGNIVLWCD